MRVSLFLVVASAAYFVSALPTIEEDLGDLGTREYPRYMEIPDGDGVMHMVDLQAEPDHELLEEIEAKPVNIEYILYTRSNQFNGQTLVINDANSITRSDFNANVPTVVIVHGWHSNQHSEPNPTLTRVYLAKNDVNVIVVDWRNFARSEYNTVINGVPGVGRHIGKFLDFLNHVTGAAFSDMHLIGFSLGAHVVGNAGRQIGGRAARVTGLDPAGPLWNNNPNRLGPNDGVYVEAIHTDGGFGGFGIGSAIARVDFFPNGGNSQPGCLTSLCNHNRAWELFAASVTNYHLLGQECSSILQITLNTCLGQSLHMGNDDLKKTGSGMYRLDTGRRYPY